MRAKFLNVAIVSILLVGVALWSLWPGARGGSCPASLAPAASTAPVASDKPSEHSSSAPANVAAVPDSPAVRELVAAIDSAAKALRAGENPDSVLSALRERLLSANPADASAAVAKYLAGGSDAATGLPFSVGQGGAFTSLPTLRSWLLSELLELDPQEALRQAEFVFEARSSSFEITVCLRNVGKIDASDTGRAYVARRAAELLADPKFLSAPDAGYAESFDALVYAGGTSHFGLLSSLAEKGRGMAVNLPAFLALDRLVIDDTAESLAALRESSFLADRPETRAGFMARADLADEAQKATVEGYLLSLSPDSPAADYFFRIVPNLNFTLTDGILTDRLDVSHEYVQERAQAALAAVDTWLSDPRFAANREKLQAARQRIASVLGNGER